MSQECQVSATTATKGPWSVRVHTTDPISGAAIIRSLGPLGRETKAEEFQETDHDGDTSILGMPNSLRNRQPALYTY